ncbi:hypothetical protein OsJ_35894 [Oryza sativa Japonica Group]|uniref:Uncharacterized protein n=1 Tax=Oryza sativa subsp. japonica TaxID=39947 RepID=A3CGS7_ORYSJ|nr:hypothetical protein OsJ_35894 [Oryza sativa Japonica Group]
MADPPTPELAAAYPSTTKGWAQGGSSAHPRVHGGEYGSSYARGVDLASLKREMKRCRRGFLSVAVAKRRHRERRRPRPMNGKGS